MAPTPAARPFLVVEDDPFLRLFPVILDPQTKPEIVAAFADFMAHDEPDFAGWCERLRGRLDGLWPARVIVAETPEDFAAALPEATIAVVEGFAFGAAELALAPRLRAVQKYGGIPRNIDTDACVHRGVQVCLVRRRANWACAEHAFALMLGLARKLPAYSNRLSPAALAAKGHSLKLFDRRFTPNGNWARVPGLVSLHGTMIGIIGMGRSAVRSPPARRPSA